MVTGAFSELSGHCCFGVCVGSAMQADWMTGRLSSSVVASSRDQRLASVSQVRA